MTTRFERPSIDLIFPRVGNIRRIIKPSVKMAIATTIIQNNGLPDEFALILRPVGDKFEAIAGNTRLSICNELKNGIIPEWCPIGSNTFTGFETVPAFVKNLTDDEAFFESARANAQGELTALEYGFGALLIPESKGGRGKEGDISRYANDIGEAVGTVRRWRTAAEVLQELGLGDRLEEFNSKTTHLSWVKTAMRRDWESLVEKIANGITVEGLRAAISPVGAKIMALKNNIQEPIELAIAIDPDDGIDLQSDLGSAIAYQQTEDFTDVQSGDQVENRAEVEKIESEMAELKANGYSKMTEAENQQPVKSSSSGGSGGSKKSDASKALHSSASQESYTPLCVWEDVAAVFGAPVELDAATCEAARSATPTEKYFTKESDGLAQLWECDNFLVNPPGGKEHQELVTDPDTGEVKLKQWGDSNQYLWFSKAEAEYLDGNAKQGIYVAFNDALRAMCPSVHQYPVCWVDASATAKCVKGGRLCFDKVDENGDRVPQNSPTHSNFFVFFPPIEGTHEAIARFEETFKKYGTITVPANWRNL